MAKGPVSGERIKSYIERVEKLLEERKAIQGDIRDVFAEAKGVGYDVRTMRKLITIRALDAADRAEQELLLDTYALAIGMESSSHVAEPTEDELIEQAGRIVGEVDRCMDLVTNGKAPKIEAIKSLIGCSTGKAHKLRGFVADRLSRSNAMSVKMKNENHASRMPGADIWRQVATDAAVNDILAMTDDEIWEEAIKEYGSREAAEREAAALRERMLAAVDDLQIPAFLRRQMPAVPA